MIIRGQSPDDDPFVPRTDFTIRRQENLMIEPELKEHGRNIPADPRVYQERMNPGPWTPGNQPGAWPQDEYIADGGDDHEKVLVRPNWEVRGLNTEDTVVHFDTLNRQTKVEPSNRVHIYSPRFGSVRQVQGLVGNEQWQGFATVDHALRLEQEQSRQRISQTAQKTSAGYARNRTILRGTIASNNSGEVTTQKGLVALKQNDHVRNYSTMLMSGQLSSSQLLRLAEGQKAAAAWGGLDGVTMIVNNLAPMGVKSVRSPQEVLVIGDGETVPKIQVFKVASTDAAKQGEIVEFLIRFDNVGSELVGNITILDSLSPRLEYIQGSAGSSLPAEFFTEPNDAGSLVLRWEITEPLKTGDFGVVRFRCRVQ